MRDNQHLQTGVTCGDDDEPEHTFLRQRLEVRLHTADSPARLFPISLKPKKANEPATRRVHHPAGHTEVLFSAPRLNLFPFFMIIIIHPSPRAALSPLRAEQREAAA